MKPTAYILLSCFFSFLVGQITAQDSTDVKLLNQATMQLMVENANLTESLIAGGGFYVNNPDIDYEIDENKLYLDPALRPHVITLVGGLVDTVPARLQLFDQVVEVTFAGRDLQIDGESLQTITTPERRHFVAYRRPLITGDPAPLLEELAVVGDLKLFGYRRTTWRQPAQQKTSYDNDNYKKRLHREDRIFLISPSLRKEVTKLKQIIELLPSADRAEARQYAKRERLRNREVDYVKLLTFLEQRS
ncbi:MAG: hypothetical protein AAFN92_10030 [Bacteroidota bacterium]